jgi:cytochrome b pre-mRNA-processing protein 3
MAKARFVASLHLRYGMIANLLKQRRNRELIDRLHERVVAAARRPALFLPPYDVPDTIEGRFDLLVLLSTLVLRRLENLPEPAPEVAQELVDTIFEQLDAGLRETGVGDLAVPKRMKKLAEVFIGRSAAYRGALAQNGSAFTAAIARNIYGEETADGRSQALAAYCRNALAAFERVGLAELLADPPFPDAETIDVRPH